MSMKVVTGDDGRDYFEFSGQVVVPSWGGDTPPNADGVVMMAAPPPTVTSQPYTLESLFDLKNSLWDGRTTPLTDDSRWTLMGTANVDPWLVDPEPPGPTGRFQNLDWEEAS